ncbi:MAG: M16 family metallopeptidase [bacterium]
MKPLIRIMNKNIKKGNRENFYLCCLAVFFILAVTIFQACIPGQMDSIYKHPSRLIYPPVSFVPPKPERVVLPNGMIIYLMEDNEVPMVDIHCLIKTGAIYEPVDKVGLAQITGEVMRSGGTKTLDPDDLDKKLEFMGVILETGIGTESGSANLSVLKKDLDEALGIFSDVLRNPAFKEEKVELSKMKMIESIRRQNDDPFGIASREFKRKVYKGDPRGRIRTIEGVERITRQDLIEFHSISFAPDNILMGISGDFEKNQILDAVSKLFGDWEKDSNSHFSRPVPESPYERSIVYAPKLLPQSTIVLGQLCCPKNHPDYFPMVVLNDILGDGFNSRLMREIRSNRGLAYSVGSFYRGDIDYGVFGAYAMTKSETTATVIDLIINELKRVIDEGVIPEELTWAKESIINKYIFSFASTAGLVEQYISLEYDNLPEDYLETYPGMISAVNLGDIMRVAKDYLKPDKSILVVVGNENGFERPLNFMGEVEKADMSIH